MSDQTKWTEDELNEFDELTEMASSRNQLERISGRLSLNKFVQTHGEEKCRAMFAHLMEKESLK